MPSTQRVIAGAGAAAVAAPLLCAGGSPLTFSLAGVRPAAPAQSQAAQEVSSQHEQVLPEASSSWGASAALGGGAAMMMGIASLAGRRKTSALMQAPRAKPVVMQAAAVDFSQELGACPPVGFWDPLGLSDFDDPAVAAAQFKRRRVIELQHGRVAMIACIGYIVPEYFKWPGYLSPSMDLSFEDIPNGLAACSKVPGAGWAQIIGFVGCVDIFNLQSEPGDYAGDYSGYGAFGLPGGGSIQDKEKKEKSLLAEINNGRLAMMAIIGMFFQDGLTGSAWGDWANYGDSPLRATPDFSQELGACPPLGFWDPLGLSEFDDPAVATAQFKRRRVIELQHGRVSMIACIGYIVPEYFKWPGFLSPSSNLAFEDIPTGLAAASKVPGAGWAQIIGFVGCVDIFNLQSSPGEYAGDYDGYGAFGLPGGGSIQDKEKKEKSLLAEINNGRLAMMAIIGMFFQDGLTGQAWGDWANYSDSPLRASPNFSAELGACPPLGFWDPLGLSEFDDPAVATAQFKRRRVIELQHGRVSMIACIGYIVPEYFKWPGYLSPSMDLKFEDIPGGLAACSKVPGAGWAQIIGFVGCVDIFNLQSEPGEYPGDYDGYGAFGLPGGGSIEDKEKKEKSLLAEINNGRLAMMAIIGMFFQDGLTGSAWGDWANYSDSPLRASPDFSAELGACPPLGFWDPLDLSKFDDPAVAVAQFKRRRVIELQHGRVSMIACIGYIVPEYFKWPGFLSPSSDLAFEDIPNGLAACSKVPGAGWAQIIGFVGCVDIFNLQSEPGEYSGDYAGYGAFGLPGGGSIEDKEKKEKSLLAEINNGRLAMMAIIGMFFQDGLTGSAWGDWANYSDSPLRAVDFSAELGACPPVGFWDPLGLSEYEDPAVATAQFKRRRVIELQHGRVSMIACIGYIVPEYFKWPGYLSPSMDLKFEDIPNGLAACSKVPGAGWAQIIGFVGCVDIFNLQSEPGEYAGDYEGYGAFGLPRGGSIEDKEKKEKSLLAEINNGRLAMMAIIGMFFQDGLTGQAWGDWELYSDSPLRATR